MLQSKEYTITQETIPLGISENLIGAGLHSDNFGKAAALSSLFFASLGGFCIVAQVFNCCRILVSVVFISHRLSKFVLHFW